MRFDDPSGDHQSQASAFESFMRKARGIDAIIAPGLGPTNVIGMNVLSRLASWRVEGQTMILVPQHPQPTASAD